MPPRQSHRSRRHDVYDDTHHHQNDPNPDQHVVVHQHAHRRDDQEGRDRRRHHQPHVPTPPDPFREMHTMMRAAERDMQHAFSGGLFGSMGGIMQSMDRMFDRVQADITQPANPAQRSYFYESRSMTVGPDGRVREETVRTVPDHRGNPHTTRTVRDGDHVQHVPPSPSRADRRRRRSDDVLIEEIDENGEPVHHGTATRRSRDEHGRPRRAHRHHDERHRDDRHHDSSYYDVRNREERRRPTGNWLRNKFDEWRFRA